VLLLQDVHQLDQGVVAAKPREQVLLLELLVVLLDEGSDDLGSPGDDVGRKSALAPMRRLTSS
jgi:hypothetical protein